MSIPTIESLKSIFHGDNEEPTSLPQRNVHKRNMVQKYRRPRSIFTKRRRARLETSTRTSGRRRGLERRVRTLKRLVPNSSDRRGVEDLFRDTADYILSLQMKVKLMQRMVKALSDSDE